MGAVVQNDYNTTVKCNQKAGGAVSSEPALRKGGHVVCLAPCKLRARVVTLEKRNGQVVSRKYSAGARGDE